MKDVDVVALMGNLDVQVCTYLVYLAHAKSSLSIPHSEKAIILDRAKTIGAEMNAGVQRIKSMNINAFNRLEADRALAIAMQNAEAAIKAEVRAIEKSIQIDKKSYFSLKQTIEVLANARFGEIVFTKDKIDRLFSFRHYFNSMKISMSISDPNLKNDMEEELHQKAKESTLQEKKKLLDIKYQNFKSYMRNKENINDDAFFKITVIANDLLKVKQIPLLPQGEQIEGLYFIDVPGECIAVGFKKGGVHVEFSISIQKEVDHFKFIVHGSIEDSASKAHMKIEEVFSASNYDTVMNSFNIKHIIEAYDAEYTRSLDPVRLEVEGASALGSLDTLFEEGLSI